MADNWFPFYLGSYAKKAEYLTQGQHGAFLCFIRYYYTHRGPIPDSMCLAIARAVLPEEVANAREVLRLFFKKVGDNWCQPRCDEELDRMEELKNKRKTAGKKGGEANAKQVLSKCQASAKQMLPPLPIPIGKEEVGKVLKTLGGELGGYDVRDKLTESDWEEVTLHKGRRHMPDLVKDYNEDIRKKGRPKHDKAAFIGWLKRGK